MKNFLSLVVVWSFIQVGLFAQGSPTHHVKTAADLVALNIPNVSTRLSALLTGVATENDGKGGLFFYQASSAVATNAHSIFKPAGSGGRWLRASLNVSEEDGSPSVLRATGIKVTNGTMTDNGDGTVSITTGAGGGGGSAPVGTVIQDNGATSAFFPAIFESTSGTNLIEALYGWPFSGDPNTPANGTNFYHKGILASRDFNSELISRFSGLVDFFGEQTVNLSSDNADFTSAYGSIITLNAETGSTDDLSGIISRLTHDGVDIHHTMVFLFAAAGDTITIKNGVNNITTVNGSDVVLSGVKYAIGISVAGAGAWTNWVVMSTAGLAPLESPSFTGTATFGTGNGRLDVGTAGVSITSDGDGGIIFTGLGNGSDEVFKIDLDNTANTGVFSSSTGLILFDFGTIGLDLDSSSLKIPTVAGSSTLAAGGAIALNTTAKSIGVHNGAKEVSIPLIYSKEISFDPKAVCDGAVDRLFLFRVGQWAPNGITITRWRLSFEADPTTEVDLDLKRADAFIGVANSAVMDVLDTTAGASTETTAANINGGAVVATDKVVYLEFGTAYTETTHQMIFELEYEIEED